MSETITKKINGHIIEYIPIIKKCTYYCPDENGICKNCNDTGKYIDGYYLIIDGKSGFMVDNIK